MAVGTAIAIAAAAASAYSGYQSYSEGKKQSALAEQQAAMQAAETQRQTTRQVELEQRNIDDVSERQKLAYLASGVTLEGSPLLKLEETRRLGVENIEEIEKAGQATSSAQIAEGRASAESAKSIGRGALVRGITGGVGSVAGVIK